MPVVSVEPKGDKAAILVMSDGARVWTPEIDKARELIGKLIPGDWTVKDGPYGPQALPPRPKGEAQRAAFRNTKEGFLAEQEGYYRKDERMDRRTALMQAVALSDVVATLNQGTGKSLPQPDGVILEVAETFYEWLRASASHGAEPGFVESGSPSETPPQGTDPGTRSEAPASVQAGGGKQAAAGVWGRLQRQSPLSPYPRLRQRSLQGLRRAQGGCMSWHVFVVSDQSHLWEQYTHQPFKSKAAALAWAKKYIPSATYDARSA